MYIINAYCIITIKVMKATMCVIELKLTTENNFIPVDIGTPCIEDAAKPFTQGVRFPGGIAVI